MKTVNVFLIDEFRMFHYEMKTPRDTWEDVMLYLRSQVHDYVLLFNNVFPCLPGQPILPIANPRVWGFKADILEDIYAL
jgi:hypothetical protein